MSDVAAGTPAPAEVPSRPWAGRGKAWLRASRSGVFLLALLVGVGSGLGAVVFRYLIYFFTWAATGSSQFGQQGYVGSSHLPWLGLAFFVLIPAIGGLLYGPLIYNWAREARGHGVPEVMIAVAEEGGRIRPQVSVVKAVASALCIGVGGSIGREGPIVQIGAALASSLGQWVKMPENRLRILVACGAGGGISATFNAPITGVFFGVEIILREFSIDALFTVMLSAMIADITAIPFLKDKPFLSGFPPGIVLHHAQNYLLVAVLAVVAALMGLAFKAVLYKTEDVWDWLWRGRPEWARPAVGGIALGLLLLALPQMYGVGYPVIYKAAAGGYVLWFLILLAFGKIAACSMTLGIGGSGGIFAPSLFIGVTSGMAYGEVVHHIFGPTVGQPALYAVVAMGAVFTSAARAPLTSLASVVEMTGDFSLTLPVMLAVAIASTISRALSYGTIYTTKLLRRGTDIDRTAPWRALADLKIADAMRPFRRPLPVPPAAGGPDGDDSAAPDWAALAGPVVYRGDPQALFGVESVVEALRQLEVYGHDGLPVLSADGRELQGWVAASDVLRIIARQLASGQPGARQSASRRRGARQLASARRGARQLASAARGAGKLASGPPGADQAKPGADQAKPGADQAKPGADQAKPGADQAKPGADQAKPGADQAQPAADLDQAGPAPARQRPPTPLPGYQLVEVVVEAGSPVAGRKLGEVRWPRAGIPVTALRGRHLRPPDPQLTLAPGDRISLLTLASSDSSARGRAEPDDTRPTGSETSRRA